MEAPRRIARAPDGRIAVRLAPRERDILAALARELADETGDAAQSGHGRDDPGLARLWPDAVPDDPEASAAFRELTAADLAEGRQARLATLVATVTRASLSEDEAAAWLGAVNDLRLVRGTRLGVTEQAGRDPIDDADPEAGNTVLYLWLGWVEEQLVEALASALPDLHEDPRADDVPG